MYCGWSEEFNKLVHQFAPGARICLCREVVVAPPVKKVKWGWGRKKPGDEIPRFPVLALDGDGCV